PFLPPSKPGRFRRNPRAPGGSEGRARAGRSGKAAEPEGAGPTARAGLGRPRGFQRRGRPSSFPAAAIQATRALMVVSLVLGFLAMFVATMGMKCTSCGGDDKVKKARIAMTGGIIFIVAGLAALTACSWYGHQIVTDFYNPLVPMNVKYEFGPAIFIGWAGSALVILGGALLSCSCPGSESKSGYR
ncbi:claudin-7-like, partial [Suricata suricatta]|uniref:claudin-7-like n=1 Tax=Suricata suricatta TaxID=37032 RepID=UPI001155F079